MKKINKNILIHIGYNKAGSTYLQKFFFPNLPVNFNRLNKDYLLQLENIKDKKIFYNKLPTIFSNEFFVDSFEYKKIAKDLKKFFPHPKILIIIRNQFDFVASLYSYRVLRKAEYRSFNNFLKEKEHEGEFKNLEYEKIISYYIDLFGKNKVLVLALEDLKINSVLFKEKILNFIDLDNQNLLIQKQKKVNKTTKKNFYNKNYS